MILHYFDEYCNLTIFFSTFWFFTEVEHGYASIPGPFVLDPDSSYTQISNHKLASNATLGLNPIRRLTTNKPNSNRKPQGNRWVMVKSDKSVQISPPFLRLWVQIFGLKNPENLFELKVSDPRCLLEFSRARARAAAMRCAFLTSDSWKWRFYAVYTRE